jgi:hypothetical protein
MLTRLCCSIAFAASLCFSAAALLVQGTAVAAAVSGQAVIVAGASDGLIAELYLIHAGICEAKQKARRAGKRRKK